MEVKIKNNGEMLDATIEMVDGVMVVSPKVEKFEQKDGDILFVKGICEHILIYKEENLEHIVAYVDLIDNDCINEMSNAVHKNNITDLRPATEEEKKKLFDKMKEEGWEWDAEKKELAKLKWKPKVGEVYYYPLMKLHEGKITSIPKKERHTDFQFDKGIIDAGWVFKTEEECQAFCDRLKDTINSVKP